MDSAVGAASEVAWIPKTFMTIGGAQYYIHPSPVKRYTWLWLNSWREVQGKEPSNIPLNKSITAFVPVTLLNWNKVHFTKDNFEANVAEFASKDDVWNRSFLTALVLQRSKPLRISDELLNAEFIHTGCAEPDTDLPNGPYVIQPSTGNCFAVSRLFDDPVQAFIGGGIHLQSSLNSFEWLHTTHTVAPSRLYYERTALQPLAGLRFAVKDIFDVAGLETGCGNKGYRELYPKKSFTAPCVQRLIDAGAVLVGKTKSSQFADGEDPVEWFDYLAPFNPRGDAYQKPSSSSTGSAAATAAYPWLDFALGTDTGGSTRHPAGVCGIYGTRPSFMTVSGEGVFSVTPLLDTIGLFARSSSVLKAASQVITDPSYQFLFRPKQQMKYKLICLTRAAGTGSENPYKWFRHPSNSSVLGPADDQFKSFVKRFENYLKCDRVPVTLEDLWNETGPKRQIKTLDATGNLYNIIVYSTVAKNRIDPFIADYRVENNGRMPFIDPVVKKRTDYGRTIKPSQYTEAVETAKVFSKWVTNTLLATSEGEIPIVIFPQSWGLPSYRDEPNPKVSDSSLFWTKFSTYSLSYLSGCPDYTVPIGEVPYTSKISGCEERLPISISMLSKPGMDAVLLDLLEEMEHSGVLRAPAPGSRMYPDSPLMSE